MPFGDGTGPMGLGPRTGRGLGFCSGYSYPGYINPLGAGRGWRRGRRWFWRRHCYLPGSFYFSPSPEEERVILKNEKEILNKELEFLRGEIDAIEERLRKLESNKKEK